MGIDVWKPNTSRTVYIHSEQDPPPYPSRHACQRWVKRGGCTALTVLDAWHYAIPVNVEGDDEVVAARYFAPSEAVILAVTDAEGKRVVKTVKYRDWLEREGKTVTTAHLVLHADCGNLYNKGEFTDGCRWCEYPPLADALERGESD